MQRTDAGRGRARRYFNIALAACVAAAAAGDVSAAFARNRHGGESEEQATREQAVPSGPLFFIISTDKQHVSVYGKNGLYEISPVSTGRPDHPTPHGIFSIIGKERMHHSNLYSGAPMPFMQRITWSGVAMHEGMLPGYAASHGCVRLPHEFARRLYGITEGNERVIISHQDIVPAAISHPHLFEPKLMRLPGSAIGTPGARQMLQSAIAMSAEFPVTGEAKKVEVAVKPGEQDAAQASTGQPLLNPIDFAKAMKVLAAKEASEAAAALSPARSAMDAKSREVQEAAAALRKAEAVLAGAKEALDAAEKRIKQAAVDAEAARVAGEAKAQAEAKVAEAEAALAEAQRVKAAKDQNAPTSQERDALEAKQKEAQEAAITVRKADYVLANAKDQLEGAELRVKRNGGDVDAVKVAAEAEAQAAAKFAEAEAAFAAAQRTKADKDQEAAAVKGQETARAKFKEAREAAIAVRKAEYLLSDARDLLETAKRRSKRAAADADAARAALGVKAQAAAKVAEAEAALLQARNAKAAKDQEAGQLRSVIEAKVKEAQDAAAAVRKAEATLSGARNQLETADRRVKRAAADIEGSKGGAEAKALATARVAEAEAVFTSAQRVKLAKDEEAASILKAYKDTDSARRAAADAAKSWERRLAPLSIFVSRSTQRLYIRQGHIKVFDVPVSIRDADKPLGTHVYIAMPHKEAQGTEAQLQWFALTVPEAGGADQLRRGRRRHYDEDSATAVSGPAASATEALDRIEVAAEVREKISEMLWEGSSLIVSDKPMSGETGDYTDFVILTR